MMCSTCIPTTVTNFQPVFFARRDYDHMKSDPLHNTDPLNKLFLSHQRVFFRKVGHLGLKTKPNSFSQLRFFQAPLRSLLLGDQYSRWLTVQTDYKLPTNSNEIRRWMTCRINLVHFKLPLKAHTPQSTQTQTPVVSHNICDYLDIHGIDLCCRNISLSFLSFKI